MRLRSQPQGNILGINAIENRRITISWMKEVRQMIDTLRHFRYILMLSSTYVQCVVLRSLHRLQTHNFLHSSFIQVADRAQMGSDARDSSFQIFDRFLSLSYLDNHDVFADITYICYASVASILISSKLHEGKELLTMDNFPHFPTEDLVEFERMFLRKIGYQITPLSTHSSFVRLLLGLCPEHAGQHLTLVEQADRYIGAFVEEPNSVIFAPSTVAISALWLSFSALHLDCREWLARIPNICMPRADNELHRGDLLDIRLCLACLEGLESIHDLSRSQQVSSPIGVDLAHMDRGAPSEPASKALLVPIRPSPPSPSPSPSPTTATPGASSRDASIDLTGKTEMMQEDEHELDVAALEKDAVDD